MRFHRATIENPRVTSSVSSTARRKQATEREQLHAPSVRRETRRLSATVDNGRLAQPEASGTEEGLSVSASWGGGVDAPIPGQVDATVSTATPFLHHLFGPRRWLRHTDATGFFPRVRNGVKMRRGQPRR
jgi:hypothetical protein